MSATSLADRVIGSGVVTDRTGREFRLTSGISREEGDFVSKLIRENPITRSIEIGCAYGISYRMVGAVHVQGRKGTWQRRLLNCIKQGIHFAMKPIPKRLLGEIFDDSVVRPDRLLKLNASMIAFRKTSPDQRPGYWYIPF